MEGGSLVESTLHDGTLMVVCRLLAATTAKQLQDLVEVPSRHGADQRHLVSQALDRIDRLLTLSAPVVSEVPPDESHSLRNVGRHRGFDPSPVALELVHDDTGHQEFKRFFTDKLSDGDDPLLSVPPLSKVEPRRGIYKQSEHR